MSTMVEAQGKILRDVTKSVVVGLECSVNVRISCSKSELKREVEEVFFSLVEIEINLTDNIFILVERYSSPSQENEAHQDRRRQNVQNSSSPPIF